MEGFEGNCCCRRKQRDQLLFKTGKCEAFTARVLIQPKFLGQREKTHQLNQRINSNTEIWFLSKTIADQLKLPKRRPNSQRRSRRFFSTQNKATSCFLFKPTHSFSKDLAERSSKVLQQTTHLFWERIWWFSVTAFEQNRLHNFPASHRNNHNSTTLLPPCSTNSRHTTTSDCPTFGGLVHGKDDDQHVL